MKTETNQAQQPQINVYIMGGYNQILPNATHAVQNYYLSEPITRQVVTELPACIVSTQPAATPNASPLNEAATAAQQMAQAFTQPYADATEPATEANTHATESAAPTAESVAPPTAMATSTPHPHETATPEGAQAPFTYEESLERVTTYINKDYFLRTYAERLKLCLYVRDVAKILVEIARDDNAPLIDKERVVKSDFFNLFLPLCPRCVKTTTASNFRQHINNELMRRPKR